MIKKFLLFILTCNALYSASLFTVENLGNVNVYFENQSDFLKTKDIENIKILIKKSLSEKGITIGQSDPSTFYTKVESITIGDVRAIHVMMGVGEEVITKRKDAIETFSFTYSSSDFMESDKEDSYSDTIESIEVLLGEFLDAYVEDNE